MAVTAQGCDYAFSHPSIASMQAAGLTFACRYLYPFSQTPGTKNLTRDEALALNTALEHGVVSNFESWWASRALDGHQAGIDDARSAQAQHTACGGKLDRPIYFSVDFDAQPAQYPAVDAYMLGVASVLGVARTGVYGSYSVVKHLLDTGLVTWAWQTYAWSGGRYDERCQLSQDKNGVPLGGAEIDLDSAHAADFGQWNNTTAAPEVDMTDEEHAALMDVQAKLRVLDFGLNPGGAQPYSSRGEIATRLRSVDTNTVKLPAGVVAVAKQVQNVAEAVAAGAVTLSDEQLATLAAAVAAIELPAYSGQVTLNPQAP